MTVALLVLGGFVMLWIYTVLVYRDGYRDGRRDSAMRTLRAAGRKRPLPARAGKADEDFPVGGPFGV